MKPQCGNRSKGLLVESVGSKAKLRNSRVFNLTSSANTFRIETPRLSCLVNCNFKLNGFLSLTLDSSSSLRLTGGNNQSRFYEHHSHIAHLNA
jgi:hypothetical protein